MHAPDFALDFLFLHWLQNPEVKQATATEIFGRLALPSLLLPEAILSVCVCVHQSVCVCACVGRRMYMCSPRPKVWLWQVFGPFLWQFKMHQPVPTCCLICCDHNHSNRTCLKSLLLCRISASLLSLSLSLYRHTSLHIMMNHFPLHCIKTYRLKLLTWGWDCL